MLDTNPWSRALVILLALIAGLYLGGMLWQIGNRFADTILLFVLAWFLAFLLRPVARFLAAGRLPWVWAVAAVYVGLFVLLILGISLLLPVMVSQLQQLAEALPGYLEATPRYVSDLEHALAQRGIHLNLADLAQRQELQDLNRRLGTLAAENALVLAQAVATLTFNAVIVLFLSFYIMLDGAYVARRVLELLPERYHQALHHLHQSIDRSFGGYVRGAAVVSGIYGVGIAVLMIAQGLSYVVPVSVLAAAFMAIPMVGGLLAFVPPVLAAAFNGSLTTLAVVVVVSLVFQQIVLNVVQPKVMGDRLGLHPLIIFLAILLGAREAGFWGLIFAVPVAAVLNSMAAFVYEQISGQPWAPPAAPGEPDSPASAPVQAGPTAAAEQEGA